MLTPGLIVAMIVCISNGEWGPAAIGIVLVLLIFSMISSASEDSKAYINRRHYWAMSPEERERERRQTKARVDREEQEARERARVKAQKQREREVEQKRRQQRNLESGYQAVSVEAPAQKPAARPKCEKCGYEKREVSRSSYQGNVFVLYQCPCCSEKKFMKYDSKYSWLIPPKEEPAQVRQPVAPVTNLNTYRSPMDEIMGTNNRRRRAETIVCLNCRSWIRTDSIEVMADGKKVREYCCPACGARVHFAVA